LTAQNLIIIISSLRELHAKCWLIAEGRFADLIDYSQTHDLHILEEANLVIARIVYNSPAEIKLNVNADASPQSIVEALKIGIDAVLQAPTRREEAKLANEASVLEMKLKEQESQVSLAH